MIQAELQKAFIFWQEGRHAQASDACLRVLKRQPDNFQALQLLGVVSLQTGRIHEGVEVLTKAIALEPGSAPGHLNLGNGLRELKRPDQALACYDRAIALMPRLAEAWANRGNALCELRRPNEALESYGQALALNPQSAEAWSNRARALLDLARPEEALASVDRALALQPGMASAWGTRAQVLAKLRRFGEAATAYEKVLAIDPHQPFVKGLLLYQKMHGCDWHGLDRLIADIEADVVAARLSADPSAGKRYRVRRRASNHAPSNSPEEILHRHALSRIPAVERKDPNRLSVGRVPRARHIAPDGGGVGRA